MKGLGAGGFLGIGHNTFRAFTAAPQIKAAVDLAHRMARQRLESGGPADSPRKDAKVRPIAAAAFVLPTYIDASAFAEALRAKLSDGVSDDDLYPLEQKKLGGRVLLRGRHVLRLGDGRFSEGRAYLHGLVRDFRKRRWRARFTARPRKLQSLQQLP